MMDQLQRLREAKSEIENPHESERIRAIAEILTEIQRAQRAAVLDQRDQLDIDPDDDVTEVDPDVRSTEVLDLVDAYTPGGPSLAETWLARAAPEDLDVDDPAALANYAGLSSEEWEHQQQTWANSYRAADGQAAEATDRDLAELHVSSKWGVSLDRFEALVVNWDQGRALRDLLAGPSEATEAAIYANTEALA
ncbi:hypothetical protein [Haloarcula onubensis]|uniref:Uncharacterized protein n=1 Tax=Haloarcula onubensis TaxID=2950539 RepID=A0ABU2FJZ9_9EURY|nr:hypothetical protein [Halomicroarcula sp. S3CR25-11]MDS0280622.1 hypothetical protein [Halomicroarcula sp. S3CR25-11]